MRKAPMEGMSIMLIVASVEIFSDIHVLFVFEQTENVQVWILVHPCLQQVLGTNTMATTRKVLPTSAPSTSNHPSSTKHIRPIGEDVIVDQSPSSKGHDLVICDSLCNAWLHCGCAGLSRLAIEQVAASSDHSLVLTVCFTSREKKLCPSKAPLRSYHPTFFRLVLGWVIVQPDIQPQKLLIFVTLYFEVIIKWFLTIDYIWDTRYTVLFS